uniref:Uncharacterized protein n=1 Tax=Heterorhabditis bacteriophora TaxID=37862 RepID=A0A1I7WFJ9_HETBA
MLSINSRDTDQLTVHPGHRPINSPSRTFGASADSIPLVPPRSPIIDPLPVHI